MDAEGSRDGARCADGRFAEQCCADVARCTRQQLVLPKAARVQHRMQPCAADRDLGAELKRSAGLPTSFQR